MALIALDPDAPRAARGGKMALIALGIFGASLFYGDGMITPAISVLSAVEGLRSSRPSLDSTRRRRSRSAILTVLFAIQRFGTGAVGRAVRAGHGASGSRVLAVAGRRRGRRSTRRSCAALSPTYGVELPRRARRHRVRRARLGRAHRHRRRGALRRHGALRPPADPARVVRRRVPGADPQLHRPGRADPARPAGRRQPVLPAGPALGAAADGRCSRRSRR